MGLSTVLKKCAMRTYNSPYSITLTEASANVIITKNFYAARAARTLGENK